MILIPWTASWGGLSLAVIMIGAWVTRFGDGRMVDVAWITAYLLALLWIAFEWWDMRRPRIPRSQADPKIHRLAAGDGAPSQSRHLGHEGDEVIR